MYSRENVEARMRASGKPFLADDCCIMKMPFCDCHFVYILHCRDLAIYHHGFHKKQIKLSKEELKEELLNLDNLSEKINDLT